MLRGPDRRTIYATIAVVLGTFLLGLLFWHSGNTDPMWAVSAFVLVYDPDAKTAYRAGVSRMLYTLLGCAFAAGAIYFFGLHKWLMPVCLGVTVFICGYFFRFQGAWRALLVCVALVVGSALIEPSGDIHIAILRAIEVAVGSSLAIAFSALIVRLTGPGEGC